MTDSKLLPTPKGFPRTTLKTGTTLYRAYGQGPANSAPRNGWFFSSTNGSNSGRFDLPVPHGTCYFSTEKFGAFCERFRSAEIVTRTEADSIMMLIATRTSALEIADMTNSRARVFGLTLDIFSGDDYSDAQAWALVFLQAKLKGVMALLRHDLSGKARNIGLFGNAGSAKSVSGWATSREKLTADPELLVEIKSAGIYIQESPYDVDLIPFKE